MTSSLLAVTFGANERGIILFGFEIYYYAICIVCGMILAAVLSALGEEPGDDEFAMMDKLSALTGTPIPKNLATLREKQVRHKDVIDKDAMLDYVLGKIQSK